MDNPVVETMKTLVSPVNKLIDVVSKGIGTIYEPRKIKKQADAEAYRIRVIGQALAENSDLPMEYQTNGISCDLTEYESIQKRALCRFVRQETQRQNNIENIADKAVEELEGKELKSQEDVSSDWMLRFISAAQDVSDEEVQLVWAKILAGEVIKPKSFSLRTLDVLKNMSRGDAELFQKICEFVIDGKSIPNNTELLKKYGINYRDIIKLDECGLINSSGTISKIFEESDSHALFYNNNFICVAKAKVAPLIKIFPLNTSAIELFSVVSCTQNDEFFLEYAKILRNANKNSDIKVFKIVSFTEDGMISYDNNDLLERDCTSNNN